MSEKINKIKKLLFEEPEREFHVRELAKQTNIAPSTASKYIEQLKKEQIVAIRKFSNHVLVKTNQQNRRGKEEKRIWNLQELAHSHLTLLLDDYYKHPPAIVLFGSYSKGEDNTNSDIDIAIITEKKEEPPIQEKESKLKRKIQLHLISQSQLNNMKKSNKELLNNIINGTVISGYLEVFREAK